MLLNEWVNHEDGNCGDHNQTILEHIGELLLAEHFGNVAHGRGIDIVQQENVTKDELQWKEIRIGQIDKCVEECIPVRDRVKQGVDCDDRTRQRQNNIPDKSPIADPIDLSRFEQFVGNRLLKKGSGDDHVVNQKRAGNDHRPWSVQQSGLLDHEVGRNQSAVEQDGEYEEEHDDVATAEIFAGEGQAARMVMTTLIVVPAVA